MSQVITLKREISIEELRDVLDGSDLFSMEATGQNVVPITYIKETNSLIVYSNGEIEVTSPSEELFNDLYILANQLEAKLQHEDEVPVNNLHINKPSSKQIVLFWPLVSAILFGLLIWKW